jgi:hypothetical protein
MTSYIQHINPNLPEEHVLPLFLLWEAWASVFASMEEIDLESAETTWYVLFKKKCTSQLQIT